MESRIAKKRKMEAPLVAAPSKRLATDHEPCDCFSGSKICRKSIRIGADLRADLDLLENMIDLHGHTRLSAYNDICIHDNELLAIIKQRKWTKQSIVLTAKECLMNSDILRLQRIDLTHNFRPIAEHLKKSGSSSHESLFFLHHLQFKRLQMLFDLGCKIADAIEDGLTKEFLLYIIENRDGDEDLSRGGYALVKSTFDQLSTMGFPIDESDFFIVDEEDYPELKSLFAIPSNDELDLDNEDEE